MLVKEGLLLFLMFVWISAEPDPDPKLHVDIEIDDGLAGGSKPEYDASIKPCMPWHCEREVAHGRGNQTGPCSRIPIPEYTNVGPAGCGDGCNCYILKESVEKIDYKKHVYYEEIWNDRGSWSLYDDVSIWRATYLADGYCSLGDLAHHHYSQPSIITITVSNNTLAVEHPTSFSQIWTNKGSGAHWEWAVYRMSASYGYTCLGDVAMRSYSDLPDKKRYCCIQDDFLLNGKVIETVATDDLDLSLWTVVKASKHGISGNNFLAVNGYDEPSHAKVLNGQKATLKDNGECESHGGCDHICTASSHPFGSYKCSCREGYTLHDDRTTCIVSRPVTDTTTIVATTKLPESIENINYKKSWDYEEIWNDRGSGGKSDDVSIWRATPLVDGYCSLGDVAHLHYSYPNIITISVSNNTLAVAHPTSFTQIWTDKGSGADWECAVYRMNASHGYTCLGDVAMGSYSDLPDKSRYCCIRDDFLLNGKVIETFESEDLVLSLWTVVEVSKHGISGNNFLAVNDYDEPSHAKVLNGQKATEKDNGECEFDFCDHNCTASGHPFGSFKCSCREGYTLHADEWTCIVSRPVADTTTAVATTKLPVPAGFELYNGRVVRRTNSSDPNSNDYDVAMSFCDQFGAKPFIPRTEEDYQLYREVRAALDNPQWLPANDRLEEGTLRWYNGEVTTNISLWDWSRGEELYNNEIRSICLWYGQYFDHPEVYMYMCKALNPFYPPICERM